MSCAACKWEKADREQERLLNDLLSQGIVRSLPTVYEVLGPCPEHVHPEDEMMLEGYSRKMPKATSMPPTEPMVVDYVQSKVRYDGLELTLHHGTFGLIQLPHEINKRQLDSLIEMLQTAKKVMGDK